MTEFTHLNDIVVQGSVSSSEQGDLIGSFKSMPTASADNKDKIVLYTGETTGTFKKGMYYISNGSKWVLSEAPLYSTNDYTSEDKAKLDGIATGAQVNVIETVKVNGATQAVVDKAVNISVPTSYGFKLQVNTSTGVISLLDKQGVVLSTINTTINRVIKSGYYDTASGNIVLVTDDNTQINIPVSDLVDTYAADGTYLTLDERTFSLSGSAKAAVDAVANKADDSAVVHKTGDTMTGVLKLTKDTAIYNNADASTLPSAYENRGSIYFKDTNEVNRGVIRCDADVGYVRTYLSAEGIINGESKIARLDARVFPDGTMCAYAPTWKIGIADNSDKILTTKMANSLPSLVHTTGNETIAGTKTFTAPPSIALANEAYVNLKRNSEDTDTTYFTYGGINISNQTEGKGFVTFGGTKTRTRGAMMVKLGNESGSIAIENYGSGNVYATAPTWNAGTADNSDKILTTKMANSLPSLVHTTGNEEIAGTKTFSTPMTIGKNGTLKWINSENTLGGTGAGSSVIAFTDKNDDVTANIGHYIHSSTGSVHTYITSFSKDAKGNTILSSIDLFANPDGRIYATAPATADSHPDTAIVTKKYLLDKIATLENTISALEARIATLEAKP